MKRSALGLLLCGLICSCTVGPDYRPPKFNVGRSFSELTPSTRPSQPTGRPIEITQWWATFHDPELNALIERAARTNPSLRQAGLRILQARENRIISGAGEWPTVNAGGGYQDARGSRNVTFPLSAFGGGGGAPSRQQSKQPPSRLDQPVGPTNGGATANSGGGAVSSGAPLSPLGGGGLPGVNTQLWQVGFDASWEVDIFGGVRRSIEAANADYQAAVEDRRDLLVTLYSEVAINYIELRGYQREIAIAQENLRTQQQTLELTRTRFQAGVTTELDVARAQAQVASTVATIPELDAAVHQTIHRLSILLGEHPGALVNELSEPREIPGTPPEIPVGMPTDLLRRRPDVRRAERELAGATARVGVATAQLYPRFTLLGTFGFDATKITHVADYSSHYYSIGPGISWPIFTAGRIRAAIRVQNQQQEQALSAYEQTVLDALRDVEDALVGYSREQMRRQALTEAVAANRTAVGLAQQQYKQGIVDFLTVLEAQRSLLAAEDQLAQSESRISGDVVAIYKALGGGWEVERPL